MVDVFGHEVGGVGLIGLIIATLLLLAVAVTIGAAIVAGIIAVVRQVAGNVKKGWGRE